VGIGLQRILQWELTFILATRHVRVAGLINRDSKTTLDTRTAEISRIQHGATCTVLRHEGVELAAVICLINAWRRMKITRVGLA
jgi:hypothetical protein